MKTVFSDFYNDVEIKRDRSADLCKKIGKNFIMLLL